MRGRVLNICIASFLVNLGNALWLSLLPLYLDGIGFSPVLIGASITAYSISLSLTFLPSGRFSDRIGRRFPMILGGVIEMTACIGLMITSKAIAVPFLLVVAGLGMGLINPAANAMVAESVSQVQSGMGFAAFQAAVIGATIAGSAASGIIASSHGFGMVFAFSAVVSAASSLIVFRSLRDNIPFQSYRYRAAWTESLQGFIGGTVRLLRSDRDLPTLAIALAIHSFSYYLLLPFIPLYARYKVGLNLAQAGIILAVWNLGLLITQFPSGRMTDRFGGYRILFTHVLFSTFSWSLYTLSGDFLQAAFTMMIFGVVGALDLPARRTIMMEYASADAGKATVIGSLDAITGSIGVVAPLFGGLVWSKIGYGAPFYLASLINLFALIPLLNLIGRIPKKP